MGTLLVYLHDMLVVHEAKRSQDGDKGDAGLDGDDNIDIVRLDNNILDILVQRALAHAECLCSVPGPLGR